VVGCTKSQVSTPAPVKAPLRSLNSFARRVSTDASTVARLARDGYRNAWPEPSQSGDCAYLETRELTNVTLPGNLTVLGKI
jgi:hypothetical protein